MAQPLDPLTQTAGPKGPWRVVDATCADATVGGGKAAGLARLVALGFAVPRAIVLAADDVAASAGGVDVGALRAALARFLPGVKHVAVRSSALAEDGAAHSFAGVFASVLGVDVDDDAALARAAAVVVASASSARVAAYTGGAAQRMAIVVQEMVPAVCAGVVFSVHPTRGDDDTLLIESVAGLGESLVGGAATPERYAVRIGDDGDTVVVAHDDAQPQTASGSPAHSPSTSTATSTATSASSSQGTLPLPQVHALARLVSDLQEELGQPVDVEWAFDGATLWFLQARPITAMHFGGVQGEWTTADFRDGGVSSDVCTPLMCSLYQRAFDASMEDAIVALRLRRRDPSVVWTRLFFGRPYWNVGEVKRALKRVPGYVERDLDRDLGIPARYEGMGDTSTFTPVTLVRAVPVALSLSRSFAKRLNNNARVRDAFLQDEQPRFFATRAALAAFSDAAFVDRLSAVLDWQYRTECAYFDTIYTSSNARLSLKGTLQSIDHQLERTGHAVVDFATLVSGLTDLSHLRPLVDLHQHVMQRLLVDEDNVDYDAVARAYADRWFFRGRRELDLRVPRFADDLPHVRQQFVQLHNELRPLSLTARAARDPRIVSEAQHERARAERARVLRALDAIGLPGLLLRGRFVRQLERVRRFLWWREEMRDLSTRAYAIVQTHIAAAGERLAAHGTLAHADDVWFLRAEHVLEALRAAARGGNGANPRGEEDDANMGAARPGEGDDATRALDNADRDARTSCDPVVARTRQRLRAGRRVFRSFRHHEPPGEIGARHAAPSTSTAAPGALTGTPCSTGRARGVVRVCKTLDDAVDVAAGEVLVAVFTDPGWTPLFSRLAAVVTETGGLLSHAAVIARETGIPAVLAVKGATTRLRTGDVVDVDGGAGTITVVDATGGPHV